MENNNNERQEYSYTAPNQTQGSSYAATGVAPPPEIMKWNWGAFMYNMWWGIGFKTYLPLLCLIPLFGIVWIFICGAKGNKWAWESGNYESVQDFLSKQDSWNRAGFVTFWVALAVIVICTIMSIAIGATLLSVFDAYNTYYY